MMSVTVYTDPSTNISAYITTPTDFDPQTESLPLILFYHGVGERDVLESVTAAGIPKYFVADPDYLGLRVITVSPCCPSPYVWNNFAPQMFDMLNLLIDRYNADRSAITITGLSMGGYGTWDMIAAHPDFFAAAAPICGGGFVWRAATLVGFPIRAFHADDDPTVPYTESVNMVNAVNAAGGNATLTNCHGYQHSSWTYAYESTDLIQWLASARRNR